jgi:hypothetical protein
MRRSNVAPRLQACLLDEAKSAAAAEGVVLNQLIDVVVAEKLSALRTEEHFRERAGRGIRAWRAGLSGPDQRRLGVPDPEAALLDMATARPSASLFANCHTRRSYSE